MVSSAVGFQPGATVWALTADKIPLTMIMSRVPALHFMSCFPPSARSVPAFQSWILSARVALAVMFLFTATSHFTTMKKDLIAMVPPRLPRPDFLVLLTGIAEMAGAIGLLIPATRYWAAWG